MDWSRLLWILGSIVLLVGIWRVGLGLLRSMTSTLPPPPPEGEMRKVNVRYRCTVCGLEIKMTLAAEEDPPPPKHCMEEMEMLAPIDL